jgi:hypothetical protein
MRYACGAAFEWPAARPRASKDDMTSNESDTRTGSTGSTGNSNDNVMRGTARLWLAAVIAGVLGAGAMFMFHALIQVAQRA